MNQIIVKEHPNEDKVFELIDKIGGQSLFLKAHRDNTKGFWLQQIKEFSSNLGTFSQSLFTYMVYFFCIMSSS